MTSRAALLILGDGRLPSGGYAHSGGLEQAIRQGWVTDMDGLSDFLRGRLHTTGLMNAAFAVAAWQALGAREEDLAKTETGDLAGAGGWDAAVEGAVGSKLDDLDAELKARTPSPELRRVGAWLGTLMLRSMRSIHPHPLLEALPLGLQQPLVYGGLGQALDFDAGDTAAAVLHEAVTGPATAAVKLMHIDPFKAHGAIIDLAPELDEAALRAAEIGLGDPTEIPALSAPLSDLAAELHTEDNVRLFAS